MNNLKVVFLKFKINILINKVSINSFLLFNFRQKVSFTVNKTGLRSNMGESGGFTLFKTYYHAFLIPIPFVILWHWYVYAIGVFFFIT